MRIVPASEAAQLVGDGAHLLVGGSGGGHAIPDLLLESLGMRFRETGEPRGIYSIHPVGLGDEATRGLGHLAQEGLLRRVVCGTLVDAPEVAKLARDNLIEAYTLPQGALSQLVREIAAGRPGLVTHVGLNTFVDPNLLGGRQSEMATEDLVERVAFRGQELLLYKPFEIDVAFLRGTTSDERGNISMEFEPIFGEMLSMAQATKRRGGVVVVQVQHLAAAGSLRPKDVKVPGFLVDYVVVNPDAWQTYETQFNPSYAGMYKTPWSEVPRLPLDSSKLIARRAAMELHEGAVCNLGSGVMTAVGKVVVEEGLTDAVVLTNEQGLIGGMPAGGLDAGAAVNYEAIVDQPYQFDFYDGGGLDLAFLSFAEVGPDGSVNISRFANRVIGIGGFINISQNAKHVVFGGHFTAGGLSAHIAEGELVIEREGRHSKFVNEIGQLTYNGSFAEQERRSATYVTERAVFKRIDGKLTLTEVAPGVDVEKQVLANMEFTPEISEPLKVMDERLFELDPMGLAAEITKKPPQRGNK